MATPTSETRPGRTASGLEAGNASTMAAWGVGLAGVTAAAIGTFWLVAWLSGAAADWSTGSGITPKSNMALGQLLAGGALLLLGLPRLSLARRRAGVLAASLVLLIGGLTLSEHVLGYDLGIDQLLAREAPGAVGTVRPNLMGVPGSISFVLLGAGLLGLARRRPFAAYLAVGVCLINLVPLAGFLYNIGEFYSQPRLTTIAWPSVVALMSLGMGLVAAQTESGPMAALSRQDAGGRLFRQWLPLVVLVPLILGLLRVQGQRWGVFDTAVGTGVLVLALIIIFTMLLWVSAARLSRAAEAQAAAEAQVRSAALFPEENPAPVLRVGRDGWLLFANRAAAGLLAEWQCEVGGRAPEWVRRAVARALQSRQSQELETGLGQRSLSFALIPVAERDYVNFYGNDITERKEAEAVLARSKEELERLVAERTAKLQELVGELEHFSYTITHDMRAPLRAMQGFAGMMAETCAQCREQEARGFLRRIVTSAGRMDSLITDALNYSRTVRHELLLEPVDTGALLRGMLDSYPELQPSKAWIVVEGELPVVMGNEAGLTQCFSNLLGNAVKFVKAGEKPEIRVRAEPRDGWVRIWVEDKGIGIPASMRPRVFDMFARGHRSYEGTGIGLALVRKVMDRMGGKVGVESEEGHGSRFWLDLQPAT